MIGLGRLSTWFASVSMLLTLMMARESFDAVVIYFMNILVLAGIIICAQWEGSQRAETPPEKTRPF